MKNKSSISTDELFSEALKNHDAEFDAAAWDHMKSLLDEDDKKPILIVPPTSKNKITFLILSIMITISILTVSTYLVLNSSSHLNPIERELQDRVASEKTEIPHTESRAGLVQDHPNEASESKFIDAKSSSNDANQSGLGKASQTLANQSKTSAGSETENSENSSLTSNQETIKDTVKTVVENGKTYKVFVRKIWVPDEYEYVERPGGRVIDDGFIGLHFTAQRPRNIDSMSAGFNLQFMSGNRIKHQNIGIYGGFDWGMQFYGRSKKSSVVLNNTSQDSGYTRLRTYSMDFLGRAHIEYSRFPLIPYVNFMAGPRIYSTGQVVASYVKMNDAQSSTSNNAHTSVSMMYGFGFGARLRISPVISIDARYEWMNGSPVKLVDMQQSTFNGLNYDLKYNKMAPKLEQIKFGIIFNLSDKEYDKKLVKEAHFKEYFMDSVEYNSSDSNLIIIPGPCVPCDSKNTTYKPETRPYESDDDDDDDEGTINIPSRSPGGKKAFPGIKPPSRPTEIKR